MSEVLGGPTAEAPVAAPPAEAAPEQLVGEALERARKSLGLSLEDVAQQLKFGARQIESLERGRFETLHGATFVRGMVRSYARLVKLDAEPLLERIAGCVKAGDASAAARSLRRPVPFSDTTARRSNFAYLVFSLVILAVGAAVAFEWHQERVARAARADLVAAAQARLERPHAPAASTPPRAAAAAPATVPVRSPAAMPPLSADASQPVGASAPAAAPPPAAASDASPPVTHAVEPAATDAPGEAASARAGRLVLSFERESWVQVEDASGTKLLSQLNAPGTQKVLQGEAPFSLVIGNARYVRLTYDGRPIDLTPYIRVEVARLTLD